MNQGLKFYSIFFITVFTLVFSFNNPNISFATLSASSMDQSNSTQTIPKDNLVLSNNLQDNDNKDNDNDNKDNDNDNKDNDNDNKDNDNDNKDNDNDNKDNDNDNKDNVPMSLPFNSNVGDQSNDEKDYSNIIPFP